MLLAAVTLVGFGVFAQGCGDDDGGGGSTLTLEQYFEQVDELDDERMVKSDELNREIIDLGTDASADDAADSFQGQVDLFEDLRSQLDAISPPAEVDDAHKNFIRVLGVSKGQFEEVIEEFRNADSVEAAFEALEDSEFTPVEDISAACRELEQIAADNDIEVDLDCDDDE